MGVIRFKEGAEFISVTRLKNIFGDVIAEFPKIVSEKLLERRLNKKELHQGPIIGSLLAAIFWVVLCRC